MALENHRPLRDNSLNRHPAGPGSLINPAPGAYAVTRLLHFVEGTQSGERYCAASFVAWSLRSKRRKRPRSLTVLTLDCYRCLNLRCGERSEPWLKANGGDSGTEVDYDLPTE